MEAISNRRAQLAQIRRVHSQPNGRREKANSPRNKEGYGRNINRDGHPSKPPGHADVWKQRHLGRPSRRKSARACQRHGATIGRTIALIRREAQKSLHPVGAEAQPGECLQWSTWGPKDKAGNLQQERLAWGQATGHGLGHSARAPARRRQQPPPERRPRAGASLGRQVWIWSAPKASKSNLTKRKTK